MCKLVPLTLLNGNTIRVAEHKRDKLIKYLELFPQMHGIDRVILFGSALEERCTEESDIDLCLLYKGTQRVYSKTVTWIDSMLEDAAYDDIIGFPADRFDQGDIMGALFDVKRKGVVLYDSN